MRIPKLHKGSFVPSILDPRQRIDQALRPRTRPPWQCWWMCTLENWVGLSGILWGSGVLFALLVAVPFIDRNPRRHWRQRPVAITLGALVLVALVILSILAAVTTAAEHLE